MGSEQKKPIVFSPSSLNDLWEIWLWNAEKYGYEHAEKYVNFLQNSCSDLDEKAGQPVQELQNLRYKLLPYGSSRKSYSHLVVFRYLADHIEIVKFFHTAQDWKSRV